MLQLTHCARYHVIQPLVGQPVLNAHFLARQLWLSNTIQVCEKSSHTRMKLC